jgi:hypothetical protein
MDENSLGPSSFLVRVLTALYHFDLVALRDGG